MTLNEFFKKYNSVALAFSGGVDSAYLLDVAVRSGAKIKAYYVKSQFQPSFELSDAKRLASSLGVEMSIIDVDVLLDKNIVANPKNRCYYCKNKIFSSIIDAAKKDGYTTVIDGTNASDDAADRPGMKAIAELGILSPLRICGLTKEEIRKYSKENGLFTWNKPAYACLATRIATDEEITAKKLLRTEKSEAYLSSLGLRDFRIRSSNNTAKLQIRASDIQALISNREKILEELKKSYNSVVLDLEVRDE